MKKYMESIREILFAVHLKISAELFPEDVWCAWDAGEIHYYKNMTPDTIDVETDWRTKEVKGKRKQLVFLGQCYKHSFPSFHKNVYI